MKTLSLVLPLAIAFASCSTQKSTTTSNSTATGSTYATSTLNNTGSTSGNVASAPKSRFYGYDINTYDPNNYMQNPEKYKTPRELGAAGGWTYNNKWNQNTNFIAEALGEWLLTPTEEVAAFWIPDSSRADTYASYWTPEAVSARQQVKMLAMQAYRDSVMLTQSTASISKGKNGVRNRSNATSGSGSTGTMAAGGINATSAATTTDASATTTTTTSTDASGASTVSNTKNYLMAVNGNMFAVPKVNLHLQNGTFVAYTGSNQLIGNLTVDGTRLKFDQLTPSTAMPAMGGFSQDAFMERIARVDSYDITNGQLRLKQGNEVIFVLGKSTATAPQQ